MILTANMIFLALNLQPYFLLFHVIFINFIININLIKDISRNQSISNFFHLLFMWNCPVKWVAWHIIHLNKYNFRSTFLVSPIICFNKNWAKSLNIQIQIIWFLFVISFTQLFYTQSWDLQFCEIVRIISI